MVRNWFPALIQQVCSSAPVSSHALPEQTRRSPPPATKSTSAIKPQCSNTRAHLMCDIQSLSANVCPAHHFHSFLFFVIRGTFFFFFFSTAAFVVFCLFSAVTSCICTATVRCSGTNAVLSSSGKDPAKHVLPKLTRH